MFNHILLWRYNKIVAFIKEETAMEWNEMTVQITDDFDHFTACFSRSRSSASG